jgi:hypothetical protein
MAGAGSLLLASLIARDRLPNGCAISATIAEIHDRADSPDVKAMKRCDTTNRGNKRFRTLGWISEQ